MHRWQTAQKTAFLTGLGLALAVIARLAVTPDPLDADGGWFNYAPNSGLAFPPGSGATPQSRSRATPATRVSRSRTALVHALREISGH